MKKILIGAATILSLTALTACSSNANTTNSSSTKAKNDYIAAAKKYQVANGYNKFDTTVKLTKFDMTGAKSSDLPVKVGDQIELDLTADTKQEVLAFDGAANLSNQKYDLTGFMGKTGLFVKTDSIKNILSQNESKIPNGSLYNMLFGSVKTPYLEMDAKTLDQTMKTEGQSGSLSATMDKMFDTFKNQNKADNVISNVSADKFTEKDGKVTVKISETGQEATQYLSKSATVNQTLIKQFTQNFDIKSITETRVFDTQTGLLTSYSTVNMTDKKGSSSDVKAGFDVTVKYDKGNPTVTLPTAAQTTTFEQLEQNAMSQFTQEQ